MDPPFIKGEKVKTIYTIREYNTKTKKYTEIDNITATTREEAKEVFIKERNWKPKKNISLFVRVANCK